MMVGRLWKSYTGKDVSSRDLSVELMDDDRVLEIWLNKAGEAGGGRGERTPMKQYNLLANADAGRLVTDRLKDGRLAIFLPLL